MSSVPDPEPLARDLTAAETAARLTLAELTQAIRATDPAAFLLPPRILRRVIQHDRQLIGFGVHVPHQNCYAVGRESLLEVVERDELGLTEDAVLPERVVLIAQPDPEWLASTPAGEALIECWRLLFHAWLHVLLERQIADGRLSESLVRLRIQRLGSAEFDEARFVLGQDDMLLPPRSDVSVYVEFIATYLELRHFAGSFLRRYFPGLEDLRAVDELIGLDIDAAAVLALTRPEGAPAPRDNCELTDFAAVEAPANESFLPEAEQAILGSPPKPEEISVSKYRWLMRKSQRPAALGNVVRAAIYRTRAWRCAPPEYSDRVRNALRMDMYRLVRRLQAAFGGDETRPQQWQEALFGLLNQAAHGIWTAEARLLFDLQKACVDHERETYTVDLVEWLLSGGRRPIKRPLPKLRDVLMLKHLRSAARRLAVVRLTDRARRQLGELIDGAQEVIEARLRTNLRPRIAESLDAVGFIARNLPEQIARQKLIEELLDRICEVGHLAMGDFRDAISRNRLKLPDLAEPGDLLRGDQLLRADRRLAEALDGVYRRGEFYLRWMQRLSSLGFGTAVGRVVTRFLVVPFAGAYVALAGVHHVWELIVGAKHSPVDVDLPTGEVIKSVETSFRLTSPSVVLCVGLLLVLLVNSVSFRRTMASFLQNLYQIGRILLVEPIRWLVLSPLMQAVFHSRVFVLFMRLLIKPLVWTIVVWSLFFPVEYGNWRTSAGSAGTLFLAINLLLNSRPGRNAEELVLDWLVQGWRRFGVRAITGLFWFIIDLFKGFLETIERLMYAVDEWLRFRTGQSAASVAAKAVLGVLWFAIAYVLRFCVTVLIEPQINPIKHFPVVTVSHKLLLGLIKPFAGLLELTMDPALSWTVALAIIWSIPGVFGFLVWELKENWRLYAANRRRNLVPVPIGSHGETMARLLRPGFHSGTLPKRYARLRRAERQAREGTAGWHSVRKHLQALGHVELAIRRYVQRELLELLAQSDFWEAPPVTLQQVQLGTNCVKLALGCCQLDTADLRLSVEVQAGWLVAKVSAPGWLNRLSQPQQQVLAAALVGFWKMAGIDLVRQQIEANFEPPAPPYDFSPTGLIFWPDGQGEVEVFYDLRESAWIAPQMLRGLPRHSFPTLQRRQLVFSDMPVSWDDWVRTWSERQDAPFRIAPAFAHLQVLPS